MAKFEQFGSALPGRAGLSSDCLRSEALLTEAIDGTLSAEEQAEFDRHLETCATCSTMLAEARRGVAWMELLREDRPQPAADLVDRILAQTSVQAAREAEAARAAQRAAAEAALLLGRSGAPPAIPTAPAGPAIVLPFRSRIPAPLRPALHTILQTRFAMTAAMAFFSVALTLNLTGVHLSDLHARDLRPANLRRGFYEANAHVVRYYENLRVVYELESRVRDLQHASDADPAPRVAPEPVRPEPNRGTAPPAGSGKPRSGLSGGAESRGTPGLEPGRHPNPDTTAPSTDLLAPHGAMFPASLVHGSPNRQKWGLA